MVIFKNENILSSICNSLWLFNVRQICKKISNKIIFQMTMKKTHYDNIYKTIGKNKIILNKHDGAVTSLMLLNENYLLSASDDETIGVLELSNYACVRGMVDHKDCITSIINLPNNCFVSCSRNGIIKFWNFDKTFNCYKTIIQEDYYLDNLLLLSNGNIAFHAECYNEFYIIILNAKNDYECKNMMLPAHSGLIFSLVNVRDNLIASASYDKTITIWDIEQCVSLVTLVGHKKAVFTLLTMNEFNILLSGSEDNSIKVWNIFDDCNCIKTFNAHNSEVTSLLALPGGYFASGSLMGDIKIWNINTYKCVNILQAHKSQINCMILLKDYRIASASSDENLIIWSY
jgi:WD40 repeat protein